MSPSPPEPVTAVWLRHIGNEAQVLVEIDGQWRLIISEYDEGPYSHIAEARGFRTRPLDRITS